MEKKRDNIILLAGNGQNAGKTLFACQLISSLRIKVIGIKICPHFHHLPSDTNFIVKTENYQIIKENKQEGSKDSNRLLNAGADKVFYIQTKDEHLNDVLCYLDKIICSATPIIIESGGLRNIIEPGLFLMIENKNNRKLKPNTLYFRKLADVNIEFDGEKFNFEPGNIDFSKKKWVIKN
jgi:hypothetical protein